jgi:hypothetical protein
MNSNPKKLLLSIVLTLSLCLLSSSCAKKEDVFESIFDGESLSGWHVIPKANASDWKAEGGNIVGTGTAKKSSYLVYNDDKLKDFELNLDYRLSGEGNTGVEIRAIPDTTGKRYFEAYHADLGHIGIGPHILGAWDFHFATRKEHPCNRGTRLLIDAEGNAQASSITHALEIEDIHEDAWNSVRVMARGNNFQFFINGKLSSEFTDEHPDSIKQGAIGLQIHDPGVKVEFKDIRLRRL